MNCIALHCQQNIVRTVVGELLLGEKNRNLEGKMKVVKTPSTKGKHAPTPIVKDVFDWAAKEAKEQAESAPKGSDDAPSSQELPPTQEPRPEHTGASAQGSEDGIVAVLPPTDPQKGTILGAGKDITGAPLPENCTDPIHRQSEIRPGQVAGKLPHLAGRMG